MTRSPQAAPLTTDQGPTSREEGEARSQTFSYVVSSLDKNELLTLGSWCGLRCLVTPHPGTCLQLALGHPLSLHSPLLHQGTPFKKKKANFILACSLTWKSQGGP